MNNKEIIKIKGIYKKKNNVPIIETKFFENPQPFDIPLEELLEDFENKPVSIKIEKIKLGTPIFKSVNWEMENVKEIDPDYKHCSEKGREKFLDMKFGMMIHWGIYSVLGTPESWPANATRCDREFLDVYYTLWQVFNPTEFNADEWAELAQKAGMQFFQLTSKHHDGFCMYDTKTKTWARKRYCLDHGPGVGRVDDVYINFSIMDTPFKRDILGEVIQAFRKRGLGIGFYFSHIDWNDPNFRWDPANRNFDPDYNPQNNPEDWKQFIEREKEQLRELCTNYGPIDQIFFDGTWYGLAFNEMIEIIKMCRKLQPDCMFSNRGIGAYGDFTSPERWIPKSQDDERLHGMLWQVCDPIHTSWAYIPNDKYKPLDVLLHNLVDAVAKGGTYVFAIAPMSNGKFPAQTVKHLEFFGNWLKKYGEAIYSSRPWKKYKEENKEIYFTRSKDNKFVYIINFEDFSKKIIAKDLLPEKNSKIILLGKNLELNWTINHNNELEFIVPNELVNDLKEDIAIAFKIKIK